MKKKDILGEIIGSFFSFDDENGKKEEYSMDEFLGYLNARNIRTETTMRKIEGDIDPWEENDYRDITSDVSILIVLLFRYAKGYIKKALKGTRLQSPDEFSFLITLMTYDHLSKSELISKQVMEKTSGTEIIKRLVRSGLIIEFDDPYDRRSIRIRITDAGRKEIFSVLPVMSRVSHLIIGNLTLPELRTLSYLLKKLDHFHNDIYINKRDEHLDDLLRSVAKITVM